MTKRHCACGCAHEVSESTERRHLKGRGPAVLSRYVLQENPWAVKPPIKKQTRKHQEMQALSGSSRKRLRAHESPTREGPSSQLPNREDAAEDAPPLLLDNHTPSFEALDELEEHGHVLSTKRRSGRIALKIAQIHERRWGSGNQELIQEDENNEEPEAENSVLDGDEEHFSLLAGDDEDEDEDEEVEENDWQKLTSAAPGQEGIPLWDWLGQDFLKMASEAGALHIDLSFP